jgi:CDP-diacylglycerol--glycerol-3-phosphate 3-phosphatidyltransferase
MLTSVARFLIATALTVLMATTVSSSFVPRASLVRVAKHDNIMDFRKSYLAVKGGSDEEKDIEQTVIPPAPPTPEVPVAQAPPTPESTPPAVELAVAAKATAPSLLGPNATPPGFLRKTFPSFPWHELPNYLTYVRCLAIPALIVIFYKPNTHVLAGVLFAIASFTDWLDGYLARRWDITSPFGAFLDPVADKLMVSTSLILLAGRYGAKVAVPATIILAREIAVSALREWMAQRGQRDVVKVGYQGKVKTALTMVSLTVLLFVPYPEVATGLLSKLYTSGLAMLYLSAVVTVTSGSVYFIAAAPLLADSK